MWSGWAQASKVKQYLFTCFLSNRYFFLFFFFKWKLLTFCRIQSCIWLIHLIVVDYFFVLPFECGFGQFWAQPLWGWRVCVKWVTCGMLKRACWFALLTGDVVVTLTILKQHSRTIPRHWLDRATWENVFIPSRNQFLYLFLRLWSSSLFCPT